MLAFDVPRACHPFLVQTESLSILCDPDRGQERDRWEAILIYPERKVHLDRPSHHLPQS